MNNTLKLVSLAAAVATIVGSGRRPGKQRPSAARNRQQPVHRRLHADDRSRHRELLQWRQ